MRARQPLLGLHASAALLLAACAGAARAPTPAPAPAEPTVAVPVPAEGTAPAAEPTGPAVAARYRSGTQRYAVVTAAYVELAQDGGALPETDSLLTRSYVTYVLGGGGAGQSVGGAVDSAFVTSRRAPATSQAVTVAVPFTGTLTTAGVRFAGDSAAPPLRCAPGAADALLGVAREVLFALPPTLAAGSVWQDSSSATTCRGNVPLTTRSVHEYRVADLAADSTGAPREAVVERTTRTAIAGQGAGGSVGTTVAGTGIARGRLTFDLAAGRYTGGAINSATDLTVNVNGRAQRLTQRAATRVTVVETRDE